MPYSQLYPAIRNASNLRSQGQESSAGYRWLLSIEWAGRTWRWSDAVLDVVTRDGVTLTFRSGLPELDVERILGVLSDSPDLLSIALDLIWPESVAQLTERGHDLAAATGELAILLDGDEWEDRLVLVDGRVSQPEYGYDDEPVTFSLVEAPYQDTASWPPADARVTKTTWPLHRPEAEGLVYPTVFGTPGVYRSGDEVTALRATPALRVENGKVLIAGHRVAASAVVLHWEESGVWDSRVYEVTHEEDGLGCMCAVLDPGKLWSLDARNFWVSWDSGTFATIQVTGTGIGPYTVTIDGTDCTYVASVSDTDEDIATGLVDAINSAPELVGTCYAYEPDEQPATAYFSVKSYAGQTFTITESHSKLNLTVYSTGGDSGGLLRTQTSGAITGAGDLLLWWLDRSTLRIDRGKWEALRLPLNRYRFSGYTDETVTPWEWVTDNLLPILPLSIHAGPTGIYPVMWRWNATSAEAVAYIEAGPGILLESSVSVEARPQDIRSAVRLQWGLDAEADAYRSTTVIMAHPDLDQDGALSSYHSEASSRRFPDAGSDLAVESDVIYDPATAAKVAHGLLARYSQAPRQATYRVPVEYAWISIGDVVTLTDAGLYLEDRVALVHGWQLLPSGAVMLTLLLTEDVARSPRSTGPDPTGSSWDPGTSGT